MITPLDLLSLFPRLALTSAQAVALSRAFPVDASLDYASAVSVMTPLDVLMKYPSAGLTGAQAVLLSQTLTPALFSALTAADVAAIVCR